MARLEFSNPELTEQAPAAASDSLYELGLRYCSGRDVAPDYVTAHKWFNLAAMRGNEDAKRYRQEIAAEMSKLDIARAQRLAREWLAKTKH